MLKQRHQNLKSDWLPEIQLLRTKCLLTARQVRLVHHSAFNRKSKVSKKEFSKFIRQFLSVLSSQRLFRMQVSLIEIALMDEGKDKPWGKDWIAWKETQGIYKSYWTLKSGAIEKITFKLGPKFEVYPSVGASSLFFRNQRIWRVRIFEPISKPSKHFSN